MSDILLHRKGEVAQQVGVSLRIIFEDKDLERLATDPSYKVKRWSPELVKAYRKRIQALHAARDERDIRALKSLHLEQLKGDRAGFSAIRVNMQMRLILRFLKEENGQEVVVVEMVDYHH